MTLFGNSGAEYGLDDVKVGAWNGDGTYGTLYDVGSVQLVNYSPQFTTAELTGDDQITDAIGRMISANWALRFGGKLHHDVMVVIAGATKTTSGSTPNARSRIQFAGGKNMPYFGLVGRVRGSVGAGAAYTFLPKCKLTQGFTAVSEYGAYRVPELSGQAVPDDTLAYGGENEVQDIAITGTPDGGTFTLVFNGQETANIAFGANAAAVETALEALSSIGAGNATVTGTNPTFEVEFTGDLANSVLPLIELGDNSLTGGTTPSVTITRDNAGVEAQPLLVEDLDYETMVSILMPMAI